RPGREASIPATRSAATTREWTTFCSSRSPSGGRRRRLTASPTSSPRWPPDEAHLREVAGGAPGLGAASLRGAALAAGDPRRAPPPRAPAPAGGAGVRARPPLHRALDPELRRRH